MTEKHLRYFFGQAVFKRGKDLFDDGAVGDLRMVDGLTVEGPVRGSTGNRYTPRVYFAENGDVKQSACDCPSSAPCKHEVALALAFLARRKLGILTRAEHWRDELGALGRSYESATEETIELRVSPEAMKDQEQKSTSFLQATLVLQRKYLGLANWELVLHLSQEFGQLGLNLAQRYRKKDGSPGRIEKYSPSRADHSDSLIQELEVLQQANANDHRLLPLLLERLPQVLAQGIPLLGPEGENLSLGKLGQIHAVPRPAGIREDRPGHFKVQRTINYDVQVAEEATERTVWKDIPRHSLLQAGQYLLALVPGILLVRKLGVRQQTVVRAALLSPDAYQNLKHDDLVALHGDEDVAIQPQDQELNLALVRIRPRPVLEISEYYESLALDLSFQYRDVLLPAESTETGIPMGKGQYLLRNLDFEKQALHVLARTLRSVYGRKAVPRDDYLDDYRSWDRHKTVEDRWIIEGVELDTFLQNQGSLFLDAHFDLRIEGESLKESKKFRFEVAGLGTDWLKLGLSLELEDGEFMGIQALALSPGGLISGLVNTKKRYLILKPEDRHKLENLLARFQDRDPDDDAILLPAHDSASLDFALEEAELEDPVRAMLEARRDLMERLCAPPSLTAPAMPPCFKGELRSYQKIGFAWLVEHHRHGINSLLADDMGLGKTIQTLCFMAQLHQEGTFTRGLLVAPVVTLANWEAEGRRFFPDLQLFQHRGAERDLGGIPKEGPTLLVTSYQTLTKDRDELSKLDFDLLILDEAQMVKNHRSKTFDAVNSMKARFRLSLTGTPVENRLMELWAQLHLLEPAMLGTEKSFKSRFANPIEKLQDRNRADQLRRMVAPFILRRRKEDVLDDLPPKEILTEYIDLDPSQRRFYETIRENLAQEVDLAFRCAEPGKALIIMMAALLRLRQCCLLPALVHDDGKKTPSAKMEFFVDFLESILAADHRILVFSQFIGVLDELQRLCNERDIPFCLIQGETKDRQGQIDRFRSPDGPRVFFLSLKAGGVGINLVEADYVLLFDPWWNPAVEMQAIDRAHRIGQKRSVTVYKLIARDTVESKILALQEKKRDLADALIRGDNPGLGTISREEAAELFS